MGRAGSQAIEAELERDKTISGQEHAAAALAIRPTAEAKKDAWNTIIVREDVPNETMRSAAVAFQVTGQAEILAPFVDEYLQMAESIAQRRGVWLASTALVNLFPRANPSLEVLEKVDSWLGTTTAPASTRRYVLEGRDDLARSLRAQASDQ